MNLKNLGPLWDLQKTFQAMRLHDPLKDLRSTLELARFHDPLKDLRETVLRGRLLDPFENFRSALKQMELASPLAQLRLASSQLELTDPFSETRKMLEAIRFADPFKHTRELLSGIQTTLDAHNAILRSGNRLNDITPILQQLKVSLPETVFDEDADSEDTEVAGVVVDAAGDIRAAAAVTGVNRLSLDFYLGLIITLLLFVYQLNAGRDTELRLIQEIHSARDAILEQYQEGLDRHFDLNTYYTVQRDVFIRSSPTGKAPVVEILRRNQITRLISRKGKWIYVEYFDHIVGMYRSGWCLKKYLSSTTATSRDSYGHLRY